MKVLVISHMYPSTFNEVAGIFVHEQVKEIVKQGHDVRVISPVPWSPAPFRWFKEKWKRYARIPYEATVEGIKVIYPRYIALPGGILFEYSGALVFIGLKDIVRKLYEDFPFDIIHAHVALPDGYAAVKLKQIYRKPVVVTIHGQDLYETINRNNKCYEKVNIVFSLVDKIILVSNKLKNLMINKEINNPKTIVIGNGIPNKMITGTRLSKNNNEIKRILSVSYLIERKGIQYNLQAIARLRPIFPNIQYVIVGDGDQRDILKNMVSVLGLKEHVIFTGLLPHQEVLNQMQQTDIFCLPSWNEAFGVVYIEAMGQGIPVIACRGEGIEDVIEHGVNGILVEPHDIDSLTEALRYLLNNPDKAKEIGKSGQQLVTNKYVWSKNAELNVRVYEEVIKGS